MKFSKQLELIFDAADVDELLDANGTELTDEELMELEAAKAEE